MLAVPTPLPADLPSALQDHSLPDADPANPGPTARATPTALPAATPEAPVSAAEIQHATPLVSPSPENQARAGNPHQHYYNGRPIRPARTIRMLVTAYSPDERSCGKFADGITASGYSVWTNGMKLVAADTRLLPFHSIITIPGYNGEQPVPVLDRGGRIKGNRLDVLYATHERALKWGVRHLDVTVWEYAD
jgi:3D (Asp-Asp-Asp) domain-containing protein